MKINSITIAFPFKPYPAQILTCSKIIDCLKNKKTGIIESPTGTGKSIAILCAVLAWHAHNRDTRIFICSRTHKQLDQLVAQLRSTVYTPKVCVLASRRVLCLNRNALKGDVNSTCRELVKKGECRYFMGKERLVKSIGDVHDIEELRQMGEKCTGCPYYASRMLSESATITFMPYNYVVDPMVRHTMGIELKNSVVIVDEAHNIEDACRSAGSIELTNNTIDIMLKELVSAYRRAEEYKEDLMVLNFFLRKMRDVSDVKMTRSNLENECACFKGDEIVQLLTHKQVVPELIAKMRMNALFKKNEELKDAFSLMFLQTIESLVSVLMLIFSGKAPSYALIVGGAPGIPTINFMLLDPDVMFNAVVQHVHALVVLSGTLTPFSAVENELNHRFAYSLVAPAVAQHTFCATILKNTRTGADMLGTYAHAESFEYVDEVIDVIYGVSESVQGGGTVVFLPSYHAVNKVFGRMRMRSTGSEAGMRAGAAFGNKAWVNKMRTDTTNKSIGMNKNPFFTRKMANHSVNNRIENVFIETNDKSFDKTFAAYKKHHNPILLAVYRGKASEGTDFKDRLARAVILIGMPCPNIKEVSVELMRNHRPGWYENQIFKAVNQAIGRCVRHRLDWGGVFLVDVRYRRDKERLCGWCRDRMVYGEYFGDVVEDFRGFVRKMKEMDRGRNEVKDGNEVKYGVKNGNENKDGVKYGNGVKNGNENRDGVKYGNGVKNGNENRDGVKYGNGVKNGNENRDGVKYGNEVKDGNDEGSENRYRSNNNQKENEKDIKVVNACNYTEHGTNTGNENDSNTVKKKNNGKYEGISRAVEEEIGKFARDGVKDEEENDVIELGYKHRRINGTKDEDVMGDDEEGVKRARVDERSKYHD